MVSIATFHKHQNMAMYSVHSVPVVHQYRAHVCSKATLFYAVCVAVTLIIPLLIAYRSGDFWRRNEWYAEQADVHFKKKLLVWLDLAGGLDYVAWSSFYHFNQLLQSHLRIPLIQSREEDWNRDGANDALDLSLDFALDADDVVQSATLILLFDYQLKRFCRLQMESMAYLQHSSPTGGLKWKINAELALKLTSPLPNAGLHTRYNQSIFKEDSIFAEDYQIDSILDKYLERNVTTAVANEYSVWKSGRGDGQPFTIHLRLRYPQQLIWYKPGFWLMVKWAWIQYFAILIVFLFALNAVKTFVFKNQVLQTVVESAFKKR